MTRKGYNKKHIALISDYYKLAIDSPISPVNRIAR